MPDVSPLGDAWQFIYAALSHLSWIWLRLLFFFFSSRRRHTRSVSAFLLNRSSDLIGRMVLAAEGRKANDSHADCYQYFCVPEYGTANGRLHFHAVHFMRTLPTGSVDPNFGRRVRNR